MQMPYLVALFVMLETAIFALTGEDAPPATSPSAPAAAPAGAGIPPQKPVDGDEAKNAEMARRSPQPGTYRIDNVDPKHFWINAQREGDDAGGAAIQLDGLTYPLPSLPASPGRHEAALDAIVKAMGQHLKKDATVRFVPTSWPYAGLGQVGGVIYLPDGHTLQDVLLRQGLARVDMERVRGDFTAAKLAKPLVDYWLAVEKEAKESQRGFWKSDPELMPRPWDDSPAK